MICGAALVFGAVGIVLSAGLLLRNHRVYEYRTHLLERIHEATWADLRHGGDPGIWRYREFNRVSYDRMVLCFWRPLTSFYERDPARAER